MTRERRTRRGFGLTVVIPTYERVAPLQRAVESVQTRRPECVEVVVVDDASARDPRTFLATRNSSGVPVRVFRLPRNRGPQSARNYGVRRARFRYVAYLDSDDEFLPEKTDCLLSTFERGEVDLVFHRVAGMDRYNALASLWRRRLPSIPFHWLAALYNPVVTPALAFRTNGRLGPPDMRFCEDYAFLLRYCTPDIRVLFVDRELAIVHREPRTSGGLSCSTWDMRKGEFRARRVLLKRPTPDALSRFLVGTCIGLVRIVADVLRGRYRRLPQPALPH